MNISLDYKPSDFDQMLLPLHEVAGRSVFECFPILKKYKEFEYEVKGLDINNVIKYIGFVYDKGSPLQKLEDIIKKKVTAALLAGFTPLDSGVFKKELDEIFHCKNSVVNLMIIRYCRMVRSRSFTVLAVGNETLHNTVKELMNYTPTGNDKLKENQMKMKLLSDADDMAKKLDATSVELLSGDESHHLNKMLYAISDMTEEEYINLSPEDFADKWQINLPSITAKENGVQVPVSPA